MAREVGVFGVRPHVRVIPLLVVFVLAVCAVGLIPVDRNERLCREAPLDRPIPEVCAGPPDLVPWLVRFAADGY